jgi:hypothetical protein
LRRIGRSQSGLRPEDGQSCHETRLLAEHKLALIEERIADLDCMRRMLKGLIAEHPNAAHCSRSSA